MREILYENKFVRLVRTEIGCYLLESVVTGEPL